jgi:hypothetical protein
MVKLLTIIPAMQSISLASDNIKFSKKKDKDVEDFMKQGMKNIVGAKLISETADITGSF